jgi:uncharacterized sulfatase
VRDSRFRYIRNYFPDKPAMIHTEYPDRLPTWAAFRRLASDECQQRARGERPSAMTAAQRAVVAQSKPAEELYDIVADPHETVNLAADPEFLGDLERLRAALDAWIRKYGDLGELPESELEERWRPGGRRTATASPEVSLDAGVMSLRTTTPGALLGWTPDQPASDAEPSNFQGEIGIPVADGRRWNLYTSPVAIDQPVWAKAWRIGFAPSDDIPVRVPVRV